MAIESKTREIDGVSFEVWKMPNMAAAKLLVDFGKFVGPAIGAVPPVSFDKDVKDSILTNILTSPLSALLKALDKEQLEAITKALLYKAKAGPKELTMQVVDYDLPNVFTVFKLLAFALEVNYSSFLEGFTMSNVGPLVSLLTEMRSAQSSKASPPAIIGS